MQRMRWTCACSLLSRVEDFIPVRKNAELGRKLGKINLHIDINIYDLLDCAIQIDAHFYGRGGITEESQEHTEEWRY